ncbi:MAG TPA: ATP synthase F0 subunit B [Candidatus Paceibacterota bacterium]|nr:ATP synthase F0 subunit B [Candidatus Paceibacterota bacterium]
MQQLLAAFGIDWHLLIAQAVNFGVVLVALWYFLYRPLSAMLAKRRDLVAKGVEDARLAGEKLASADSTAHARVQEAETEAESIVASARDAATSERARIMKEAEARAAQAEADARARAEEDAAKVRRETEKDIARVAILAAEKVMRESHD